VASRHDAIVEMMLNPDGRLWIDRLSSGLTDTGETLSAADGDAVKSGHIAAQDQTADNASKCFGGARARSILVQ
jgi:Flp pilus assembly CpaF family ATPase